MDLQIAIVLMEQHEDDDYHFVMQILGNLKRLDNLKRAMAKVYILQYLTSIEYDIPIQPPVSSIDIN